MGISLFGWLDKISWWVNLPYPTKGALLRAMKSGLSVVVAILLAELSAGLLFPEGTEPAIIVAVTIILQSVDKFLRETALLNEQMAQVSDNATP